MAQNWYLIDSPYDINDDNSEVNSYSSVLFQELVDNSPERYPIKINNGQEIYYIVQKKKDGIYNLITPVNTVNCGDYVDHKSKKWIVVSEYPDDNKIWETSEIKRCNHTLKYQDKSGILYEVPAIIADVTSYSDGVSEGRIINVPDGLLNIIISKNSSTDILELDKRLIVDNMAWKITKKSGLKEGIYEITCQSDQKNNAMDDLVNSIADKNQETEAILYTFEYPSEVTTQINNVVNYSFIVKKNGEIVNNPSLDISVDNSNVVLQSGEYIAKTEGICNLTISFTGVDGVNYVNMIMVNVVAVASSPSITYQILSGNGSFDLRKYMTGTYSIQKYRDGYPVEQTYSISVLDDNIGLIEYEVSGNNSIDITNIGGTGVETIVLIFSDLSTGSTTTQAILLK